VAVKTVRDTVQKLSTIEEVIFCCFSGKDLEIYEACLKN